MCCIAAEQYEIADVVAGGKRYTCLQGAESARAGFVVGERRGARC